jgi:hypothetical protein
MSTNEDHYLSSLYTSSTPLVVSYFFLKTPLEKNKPLKNAYKFSKCFNQMNLKLELN